MVENNKVILKVHLNKYDREAFINIFRAFKCKNKDLKEMMFKDHEENAKNYYIKLQKEYGRKYNWEYTDPGEIHGLIWDEAFEYYELEVLMEHNLVLSLISTMYQVFEQQLRSLLYKEFNHRLSYVRTKEKIEKFGTDLNKIKNGYNLVGYNIEDTETWPTINELNKLSNAFKHGQGYSFKQLMKINPNIIKKELRNNYDTDNILTTNNEVIFDLDAIDFENYADKLINFWIEFPENLTKSVVL
ncbi:hypothetical protein CW674_05265 [Macrococcoides caseolyticum]|uniref:hypothetical protein n=1 Tax=Macrococcoides caseolyticum TaxID=69966 RepID=UPI000C329D08|nr:hypothetical protein [Macrococcus caseolyticus]PKE65715.1 hypothetical protein CW674_05265 [Macrococcus caseolyticus]